MDYQCDVLVIGTGPGGEGAAMKAAKAGKEVVVVDARFDVGGNCTHRGTIPSKALRHAVRQFVEFQSHPLLRQGARQAHITFPKMIRSAQQVMDKQVKMRHGFYTRNNIEVIHGHATFVDPHHILIQQNNGAQLRYHAEHIIIGSGSSPYRPAEIDFTHPAVRDSDTILELDRTPGIITIFGAGVIGCEYACIFRNMGVKVNLINGRDQLLSFLDEEICDALAYHLRDQGVLIRNNEKFDHLEYHEDGVVVVLASGKRLKSDLFLWAAGRSGNSAKLNLESIGVTPNSRGSIPINDHYQVQGHDHIYAVGDVVGFPSLASAAYDQGRFAASHLLDPTVDTSLVEHIPAGIYTIPEISSIGKTERELTEACVPYEVGHAMFRHLARAQIAGVTVGMLKLLFHRETLEILGIHCFGHQASEILHIGQAIMQQPAPLNTITYFINTTFNYPTMAEAYRVAALNGMNRLA